MRHIVTSVDKKPLGMFFGATGAHGTAAIGFSWSPEYGSSRLKAVSAIQNR